MDINLDNLKKIHIIGIKGSGIIAVVEILHHMGKEITGSDTAEKFFTDEILGRLGIRYFENFDAKNIPQDTDLVIYSTAYNADNNVEIKFAKENNLLMMSYPEMLAYLFNQKYGLAICGTHGKTTTSALLANAMKVAGADPTAVIGSKVLGWGGNALVGQKEFFVAEADEYQNKLSFYNPKGVILTSCDWDHPDYFETFEKYKKAFADFVARIPQDGFLVVWGDSVDTLEVAKKSLAKVLTYGFGEDCDYKIKKREEKGENEGKEEENANQKIWQFEIEYKSQSLGKFEIQLVGKHNILNATAAIAVCHKLNLDLEKVREGIKNFYGTSRRFEYVGKRNGAILIDDYGHHPQELQATLAAAREIYPEKNIWAVFHPHTFTRTKALLSEFSQSFSDVDHVIVLDIYGSAREVQGGVHSKDLAKLINKFDRDKAQYLSTISEAVAFLKDKIGADDVVITIGAGNAWEVVEELKEK